MYFSFWPRSFIKSMYYEMNESKASFYIDNIKRNLQYGRKAELSSIASIAICHSSSNHDTANLSKVST